MRHSRKLLVSKLNLATCLGTIQETNPVYSFPTGRFAMIMSNYNFNSYKTSNQRQLCLRDETSLLSLVALSNFASPPIHTECS